MLPLTITVYHIVCAGLSFVVMCMNIAVVGWKKLIELAGIFCIDIAAYSVMPNHYHVVLHINKEELYALDVGDVIQRWHSLFRGSYLRQRYCAGESLSAAERDDLHVVVETWGKRLTDVIWFMRIINRNS